MIIIILFIIRLLFDYFYSIILYPNMHVTYFPLIHRISFSIHHLFKHGNPFSKAVSKFEPQPIFS